METKEELTKSKNYWAFASITGTIMFIFAYCVSWASNDLLTIILSTITALWLISFYLRFWVLRRRLIRVYG